MFKKLFSARSLVGSILLLILVGEPTVAAANGLFTPPGFVVLILLYFCIFHLFESLIVRYNLVAYQVLLLGFSIYAVLVTGLLHGEIANYITVPQDNLVTTLIRIQASMFPVFAFYLLNKFFPRKSENVLSVKASLIVFVGYILLLTPSGVFGVLALLNTLKIAPLLFMIFSGLALAASIKVFTDHPKPVEYSSKLFTLLIIVCLILGLIPSLISFLLLLIVMPLTLISFMFKQNFRNMKL